MTYFLLISYYLLLVKTKQLDFKKGIAKDQKLFKIFIFLEKYVKIHCCIGNKYSQLENKNSQNFHNKGEYPLS